jgi:uncharacterized protein (DUF58 family)
MRRIDWKATARQSSLQSRVYEPSSTLHLLLALNLTTFEQTWAGYDPVLLERMVTVGASVATQAQDDGYAVGLIANCSFPAADRAIRIPIGRHPQQILRLLEALASVGPFMISSIEDQLHGELHSLPLGTTVVLVTALLPDSLMETLTRVREAGHRVMVLSVKEKEPEQFAKGIEIINVGTHMRQFDGGERYVP